MQAFRSFRQQEAPYIRVCVTAELEGPTHSHGGVLEQTDGVERRRVVLNQTEPSSQVIADRVAAHQMVHLTLHRLLTLTHCRDTPLLIG